MLSIGHVEFLRTCQKFWRRPTACHQRENPYCPPNHVKIQPYSADLRGNSWHFKLLPWQRKDCRLTSWWKSRLFLKLDSREVLTCKVRCVNACSTDGQRWRRCGTERGIWREIWRGLWRQFWGCTWFSVRSTFCSRTVSRSGWTWMWKLTQDFDVNLTSNWTQDLTWVTTRRDVTLREAWREVRILTLDFTCLRIDAVFYVRWTSNFTWNLTRVLRGIWRGKYNLTQTWILDVWTNQRLWRGL